jgi:hypothetical protein
VIGDKIVAAIEQKLDPELAEIWRWRTEEDLKQACGGEDEFTFCADGSRGGRKGMILKEEMDRRKEHADRPGQSKL